VPAHAEIVLEGRIRTDVLEPEAPFGEASGYLGPRKMEKIFEITAVTHRRKPIYQGIISEFPPSESTVVRKAAFDAIYLKHLRDACNIPSVKKVASHEMASCNMMFVIQLDRPRTGQPWQALRAAAAFDPSLGKVFVAVDSDVDPIRRMAVVGAVLFDAAASRCRDHSAARFPRLDPFGVPVEEGHIRMARARRRCSSIVAANIPICRYRCRGGISWTKALERWKALGLPS
jgi:4-hydroxy-3-polyprenylbenzoate decarboxylase